MNSLSWLIYAAEVFARVSVTLVFTAIVCCVAALVTAIVARLNMSDLSRDSRYAPNSERDSYATKYDFLESVQNTWPLRLVKYAVFCLALSLPIPSSSTVYMIAASEMGEKIATTPEAREMLSDLRQIVSGKLRALKTEAVK